MHRKAIAGWGFVIAGLLFLGVGAAPVLAGGQAKTTYIVLAMAFLILGAAIARRRSGTPPGA